MRPYTDHDDAHRQPPIRARVPRPMLLVLDEAARRAGMRRSALVRELLVQALTWRGLWPPSEPRLPAAK